MHTVANTHLSINAQAWAILALLSQREPNFAPYDDSLHDYDYECTTSPWYNGRERGICLVILRPVPRSTRQYLVITFGENRNSDHIFIDHWVSSHGGLNPPTIADMPEGAYHRRRMIAPDRIDLAVEAIVSLIQRFYSMDGVIPPFLPDEDGTVVPQAFQESPLIPTPLPRPADSPNSTQARMAKALSKIAAKKAVDAVGALITKKPPESPRAGRRPRTLDLDD